MSGYKYIFPADLPEALRILAGEEYGVTVLGGGTDLLVRVRDGKERPGALLDLSSLNLDYIEEKEAGVVIGAMTSLTKVIDHAVIRRRYPILAEAAAEVGGFQTRNMGTIGGNICTGLPSADMAIPLLVLEAKLNTVSLDGAEIIPVDRFFIAPRKIRLAPGALLKEIIVSSDRGNGARGSSFIKFGKRKAMRLCIISVGVNLLVDPATKVIDTIRIAMGTMSPIPLRLYKVEAFMTGKPLSDALLKEAVAIMETEISPRTSLRATCEFRTDLARVLLKRAVNLSAGRAMEGGAASC
ncbi:MAG: FAD binding domain-containing protein [Bacillota bacterium]